MKNGRIYNYNKTIMEKFMRKFAIFFTALILMMSILCSISVSAAEYVKTKDDVFAVSRGGDTTDFPQNSLEAITACLDLKIDGISATAKLTQDGKVVLFESDSTKDICVDKNGNTVDKKISETDYKTLSSFYLLSSSDINTAHKTNSKIALLSDALKTADKKMILIIDCDNAVIDKAYDVAAESGYLDYVVFRCRDMKKDDLLNWASSKTEKPEIIASYKGNVIFSAISTYNFAEENNLFACEFTTKNLYGVIYNSVFTSRFEKAKVIAPVYNSNLAGKRPDSVKGWEDLLSRGYNIIETANAREFSSYITLMEENRLSLERIYNESAKVDLSQFTDSSTKEFSKHMKTAEEIIKGKKVASSSEISECIENIRLSTSEFEKKTGNDESAFSVTPMKIFWIAFALALFAASQIYIFRKTKKS